MSKTSDSPEIVTVRCRPSDYEATRDQLERHGYTVVACETGKGFLLVTGNKRLCSCDLCSDESFYATTIAEDLP
jgi:hypothetical protein